MILIADASFAAKVLLREVGSEIAQDWWRDENAAWLAPTLIASEVEAAIAVHHRNHPTVFGDEQRKRASTLWASMLDGVALHTVDRPLADAAIRMIQDYGPLRGADACYLAVAERVGQAIGGEVVLGSFDRQQRTAAYTAGFTIAPGTLTP